MKKIVLGLFLLFSIASATPAQAQFLNYTDIDRTDHLLGSFGLGLGVVGNQVPFYFGFQADYFVDQMFSIGALTTFNIANDFLWTLQGVGKATIDIESNKEFWRQLKPYGQAQLGFGIVSLNTTTCATFLAGFGFGADYFFNSRVSAGTGFLFNFGPDIGPEVFLWDWSVVKVSYLF